MPHLIVKLFAGRTEEQKRSLTEALTAALKSTLNSTDESISIAIEDFNPAEWNEKVYQPDIAPNFSTLYKKPGY